MLTLDKHVVKPVEIVFLLPGGKKHTRQFKTEEKVAEYLKVTHATAAPISFSYADGSVVTGPTLERIYQQVFESFSAGTDR
jgi:hypothetical protein